MLISIRPEKEANQFLSFQTLSKVVKNIHRIGKKNNVILPAILQISPDSACQVSGSF